MRIGTSVYFSPGLATQRSTLVSTVRRHRIRFDPSIGAAVGFNKGNAADLRGLAWNVNIAVALADLGIGGSVTYSNGQSTGASYGIGSKGVPSVAGELHPSLT